MCILIGRKVILKIIANCLNSFSHLFLASFILITPLSWQKFCPFHTSLSAKVLIFSHPFWVYISRQWYEKWSPQQQQQQEEEEEQHFPCLNLSAAPQVKILFFNIWQIYAPPLVRSGGMMPRSRSQGGDPLTPRLGPEQEQTLRFQRMISALRRRPTPEPRRTNLRPPHIWKRKNYFLNYF